MRSLLLALAMISPAASVFFDPATGQTTVVVKPQIASQRCYNVPKYGHISNVMRVFLTGFTESLKAGSPTDVQVIYQARQGPKYLYVFNMKSQASNDFFSIVVANGVVQDFLLTTDYNKMLSHHGITDAQVQGVNVVCAGIKEQFAAGFQNNVVGSAAPN